MNLSVYVGLPNHQPKLKITRRLHFIIFYVDVYFWNDEYCHVVTYLEGLLAYVAHELL